MAARAANRQGWRYPAMPSSSSASGPEAVPRVSIVIPAYNSDQYVGETIESVIAQTMSHWELLVFDDGSTDSTADAARTAAANDPRITVLRGPNGGVAKARNRGFAATDRRTEFVIFLDSDDVWQTDSLELLVGHLERHPEHGSVYGSARCIDAGGAAIVGDDLPERMRERWEYRDGTMISLEPEQPTTFATLVGHNWVVTPGLHLIRRAVLEKVGAFDPRTDPADDWDLVLRLSRRSHIGFIDRCVLSWRRHPDGLTTTSPRWRQAHWSVRRKSVSDSANSPEQRRIARQSFRRENNGILHDATRLAFGGDLRSGLRQLAKGLAGYGHYARSCLRTERQLPRGGDHAPSLSEPGNGNP